MRPASPARSGGPGFAFTAGEYVFGRYGSRRLRHRSRLPILTVGTGLYLRALLEGLAMPRTLRGIARTPGGGRGQAQPSVSASRLAASGPEAAIRIGSRDRPKMIRAIEVCLLTGRPLTEVHRAGRARLEGYAPSRLACNLLAPRCTIASSSASKRCSTAAGS